MQIIMKNFMLLAGPMLTISPLLFLSALLVNIIIKHSLQDSPFYCELFYPGQNVAGPSRLFRDVEWINGPRPVATGNQRICCVIEEVINPVVSFF